MAEKITTICSHCENNKCMVFQKQCYEPWETPDAAVFCDGSTSSLQKCNWLSDTEKINEQKGSQNV